MIFSLFRSSAEKNNVSKLKIKGKEHKDDNKSFPLDLLQDRIKEEISHNLKTRTMSYEDRQPLLHEAWHRRQEEMLQRFPDT